MKIALFANASAGGGRAGDIVRRVRNAWPGSLIGIRGFGGELLENALPEPSENGFLPRLNAAVSALLREKPDAFLCIGGDGTAAYVAETLMQAGAELPLIGIGAGTANVGPIVSFSAADELPAPEELSEAYCDAVEALDGEGRHIAYGFNDLVLGNTFLGTKNGRTVTLDAGLLIREGSVKEAAPLHALGDKLSFRLNGETLPPTPFVPSQIIAGPVTREHFYGKAVTGVLCYTPSSPQGAAVLASPHPLVSCEESAAGYTDWFTASQLLLSPEDSLTVSGLAPEVSLIADGNPYPIQNATVTFKYIPNRISVLRRRQS